MIHKFNEEAATAEGGDYITSYDIADTSAMRGIFSKTISKTITMTFTHSVREVGAMLPPLPVTGDDDHDTSFEEAGGGEVSSTINA